MSGSSGARPSEDRCERASDLFELPRFFRGVFVLADGADAERTDERVAIADGDAEGAADAGLFGAGFGDAAGVGLEIADGDGFVLGDDLAGDAFADGDGADEIEHLRRQPDLRDQVQQLGGSMQLMDGPGLGLKSRERVAEKFFQFDFVHKFMVARRVRRKFAVI